MGDFQVFQAERSCNVKDWKAFQSCRNDNSQGLNELCWLTLRSVIANTFTTHSHKTFRMVLSVQKTSLLVVNTAFLKRRDLKESLLVNPLVHKARDLYGMVI